MRRVNGQAVRAIRDALGISQADLARRVEVSKAHISQLEAGKNGASPGVTRRIAEALNTSYEAITEAAA